MVDLTQAVPAIRSGTDGLLIGVRVSASAPGTTLQGVYGGRLKVSVGAPPRDGRANRELTRALAGWLGVRRADVQVEAGHGSRDKVLLVTGMGETELREKLMELLWGSRRNTGE